MSTMMGLPLERPNEVAGGVAPDSPYQDTELLEMFKEWKKESFENRWIWERGWMRNIHYVNNRQWIEYVRRSNEWRDVRLAKWFPKPVTNKLSEGVQALRAMFAAVNIGVNVRPNGSDPKNVAVAAVCDDLAPLLHEEHHMDDVMDEADFWFIVTGNVFLHTYFERDVKHGFTDVPLEQCVGCGVQDTPDKRIDNGGVCPECQHPESAPAMNEDGSPAIQRIVEGKGVTQALSPFELVFPNSYARFEDVPYVMRLRWRTKKYYEESPTLKSQVVKVKWAKAPSEQALQLFRSLPYQSDMNVAPFLGSGGANAADEEGATEYEVWVRPCDAYPEGLVFRVLGDGVNPIILHLEQDEAIPGPLPYVDKSGKGIFTFSHAAFEQRGGRIYGTAPLDGVIQKQNQLNQLDAFIIMIINRMGNPLWLVPKGSEIERFTGEPGLVVKWNPLTTGGNAKPERVDGMGPNPALFQIRQQYLQDIEEGLGTFDVLKGQKPAGVEAFSALQLMVERGQSRFASAFKARGNLYKDWFKYALEIEREFGPEARTRSVLSPSRVWTVQQFQKASLQGDFDVIVEDGSNTPKTTLGIRAAIEHLNSLGFINPQDPDQKYKIFQLFGQSGLSPSLDIHIQSALRKQQAFEEWAQSPQLVQASMNEAQQAVMQYQQQIAAIPQVPDETGMMPVMPPPPPVTKFTPLAWKGWYNPQIHLQEFMKWANGDAVQELLKKNKGLEGILDAAIIEMQALVAPPPMPVGPGQPPPGQPGQQPAQPQPQGGGGAGAGRSMANSNAESGGVQNAGNHAAKPGSPATGM